jgi:uncharacterized protein YecT (DUF1311 family)
MKKMLLSLLGMLVCMSIASADDDYSLNTFEKNNTEQRIRYFNSLGKNARLMLMKDYLVQNCFDYPIDDAVVFKKNGDISIDWMVETKDGQIEASVMNPGLLTSVPYRWTITDHLVISRGMNYEDIAKMKGGGSNMPFNLDKARSVDIDGIALSNFQNRLCITLNFKTGSVSINETGFNQWNFYDEKMEQINSKTPDYGKEYDMWDRELNFIYGKLQKICNNEQKNTLLDSQKQWLKYRDGEFKFIESQTHGLEGSMYPEMVMRNKTRIVKDRISELLSYLNFFQTMR